jgi:ribonuclease HI
VTTRRKAHPARSPRLFAEPHAPADVHTAHVDGAARGNPGPASYAVVLHDPAGREVYRLGKAIGRNTNNVAEYHGLIAALDYAAGHGIRRLRVRSDSELLVRQMQGLYKVKSAELKPLHERAQKLARGLEYFAIEHVRREWNADADALANEALDGGSRTPPGVSVPRAAHGRSDTRNAQIETRRAARHIRATYRDGVLLPMEPLDLTSGEEVEIIIRRVEEDPRRGT